MKSLISDFIPLKVDWKRVKPFPATFLRQSQAVKLSDGQILEAVVVKAGEQLVLESRDYRFKANDKGRLKIGESVYLKVINADADPVQLKYVTPLMEHFGTFGKEVDRGTPDPLSKEHRLQPLIQYLATVSRHWISVSNKDVYWALREHFRFPQLVDGRWVMSQMASSGLFFESYNRTQKHRREDDLKSILLRLDAKSDAPAELAKVLEGIMASQVSAIESSIEGGTCYHCLLPFLDGAPIQLFINQNPDQKKNRQWIVCLEHQSREMGKLKIDILLQDLAVSIHFRCDRKWLVELVEKHKPRLISGVEGKGMNVRAINATILKTDIKQQNPDYSGSVDLTV